MFRWITTVIFAILILGFLPCSEAQCSDQQRDSASSSRSRRAPSRPIVARPYPDRPIEHGCVEQERGSLFPGESITYRDVTVTWEVAESPSGTTESFGILVFESADPSIPDHTMEGILKAPDAWLGGISYCDTVLRFRGLTWRANENSPLTVQRIDYEACFQPRDQFFDACGGNTLIYVSSVTPIHLNEWILQLSDRPTEYPDGSEYYEIQVHNTIDGTTGTLPAIEGATRKFGRFAIAVRNDFHPDNTLGIHVNADRDPSVRGRDACVDDLRKEPKETLEELLFRLGNDYGFELEWMEYPGHRESIDYLKVSNFGGETERYPVKGLLSDLLPQFLQNHCGFNMDRIGLEWVDSTHLRITPIGYEETVAWQEAREDFKQKFSAVTKVYRLEKITPITAKALIDQELRWYGLSGTTVREGIASLPDTLRSNYAGFTVEQCIADEMANAVIVTAIPETHAKIEKLLAEMDSLLAEKKEGGERPSVYGLTVYLLQGMETGNRENAPTQKPSSETIAKTTGSLGIDTVVESIIFENQPLQELIAMLSTVSASNVNVAGSVPNMKVSVNIQDPRTVREILQDLEKLYDLWVDYQPGNTIVRPGWERERQGADRKSLTLLQDYGIAEEDLAAFGFVAGQELGKGMVSLVGQRGDEGNAKVALSESYTCEFEYMDFRKPYLILKGRMLDQRTNKCLLENTLYLEPDKPALLGLTNMRNALILIVRWQGGDR